VKNPESDRIHYYLGSLYEETGRIENAIEELKQVQVDSKLYGDSALHVAFLLKQQKRVDDSRKFIAESIEKSPRISSFYIFQASLDDENKDLKSATKIMETAVEKFPEDEKVRYYLGSLYDRTGDYTKSLEQMEKIIAINPDNVDALNYIGYTWTQQGVRLNDAERVLRKAMALRPNNAYIQDSWGWYLFVRGRLTEAVVELEKAAKLRPNEPTILEHLGDAYVSSNLREKALQQYQEAVRYAEDETARSKVQGKMENLREELAKRVAPEGAVRSPAGK
jgi:tetratricopeptide (TPR) repeat protein